MPSYLTVTFEYECAEDVIEGFPGVSATSHTCEPVSNTPPVVLSGLVKGGEYATAAEFRDGNPREALCVSARGRIMSTASDADDATFPLTWYRYEEP
jgi:hypothetical protein